MAQEIRVGSILVKEKTVFPAGVAVDRDVVFGGWEVIRRLDGCGLMRMIAKAGWNFFYMAGEIKRIAIGTEGPGTFRSALMRIVKTREMERYNALEITRIAAKRFLGVPFVRISVNARHIQKDISLLPTKNVVLRVPVAVPNEGASAKRHAARLKKSLVLRAKQG